MSLSERGMPRRFLPGNATKFLHRRSMELLGLCLLTLAFSFLLINLTYNSADPSFNPTMGAKMIAISKSVFFIVL